MKETIRSLGIVGGCVGLLAWAGAAGAQGFYVDANAGVSLADDVDIHRFVAPTPRGKFELDPGPRIAIAGGYNFNQFIGVQLETGAIANEVKHVDATLAHVPLLADVVVRYEGAKCNFIPYAGIGAGGDVSIISLDHVRVPGGGVVDGTGSELVFAWQVFAGVRYRLNDRMSVGGGYKYFSADGANWDVEHARGDIKSDDAHVHSFGVDFNMTF
jgi:opacity protein-like surface antigen